MTKIIECIRCGELKKLSKKDLCKQCHSKEYREANKEYILEQKRKYRQRPEVRKRDKEYRQRPEVKKHLKEWHKNYHRTNKKRIKEYSEEYRNRPKIKERIKNYRKANKEHTKKYQESIKEHLKEYRKEYLQRPEVIELRKEYYHSPNGKKSRRKGMLKRIERMDKIIHDFDFCDWWDKVLETEGICPACRKDIGIHKLTMDHIVPVSKASKGFTYTIKDITPLCKSCNSSKGNSTDEYDLMIKSTDTTMSDFVEGKYLGEILEIFNKGEVK